MNHKEIKKTKLIVLTNSEKEAGRGGGWRTGMLEGCGSAALRP